VPGEDAALPGQETLLACWSALAQLSPDARLVRSAATAAAVFPSWAPLNNAIALHADEDTATEAAPVLTSVYGEAGVDVWALWIPSRTTDLDAPGAMRAVGTLARDTTTLVMHATMPRRLRFHDGVIRTSLATVMRVADDEAVPALELGTPDAVPGLASWVMVHDGLAVACAWTYLHERDCGIYAVGTLPPWRRRGLAQSLVEHMLTDARSRGARTATLQSTRMGQPLYDSLGFEPAGRYEEWVST
jgi:GNAT superfamily N-acetyltransferase